MKKFLYSAFLMLLLATFLLAGLWRFYPDQVLNRLARPLVETVATDLLAAEVRIGQLIRTETGLEIRDLSVTAPPHLLATLPRVELNFSLASLWHRQLDALHVAGPRVAIIPAQQRGAAPDTAPDTAPDLPHRLPLTIGRLTVADGLLSLTTPDRQWQLRQLNFSGALQAKSDFLFSAFFGADETHPLAITGSAELAPQPSLTLERLSWRNRQLLAAPLSIALAGSNVRFGRGVFQLNQFDHLQLRDILAALGRPSPFPADLVFSLTEITVLFAPDEQPVRLEVQVAQGRVGRNGVTGAFTALKGVISGGADGWEVAGRLQGPGDATLAWNARRAGDSRLTGQAQLTIPDPGRLAAELFGAPPLHLSGGLQLAAEYVLDKDRLALNIDLHGRSAPRPEDAFLLDIGLLDGRGELLLAAGKEQFALTLQLASQPFFSVGGDFRQLSFTLAPTALADLDKLLGPGHIPEQIRSASGLAGTGQFSRDAGQWAGKIRVSAAEMVLPGLVLNDIAGRSSVQLASGRISFEEAVFAFALARQEELSARVEVRAAGQLTPRNFSLALQQLSLAQLNYLSPDGQTGIGAAALDLRGVVEGPWSNGPLAVDVQGSVAAGEILSGAFYADLSAYRADLSVTGKFAPGSLRLTADSVTIEVPQLGSLTAAGRFGPEQISAQGQLAVADLAASYGERIGPLLSDFSPALDGLLLAGAMSLDGRLLWNPDRWQTNGTLRFAELDASWPPRRLELVDGSGSVPFAFSSAPAASAAEPGAASVGTMSFGSFSAGPASLKQGRLELAASNNRFRVRSPLLLQLAEGRLAIEQLTLSLSDGQLQGSVQIEIAEVELEALTEQLGLPVMQGRVSADLGTILYADRQLSSDGVAEIEVFGGRFQLRNMRYRDPFSSYPAFHADIDFSGLDLLQATRTFDFGEINGLLDGHIHGLKLFGSTPAAFDAAVATRPRGKRNISVKALKNISVLSQGGIASVLSQGVYRFIDFYRYRTIGFKCSLENDIFTLVGTARPGSDRYLVHGGLLPPRIDIITSTPTISFKEMIDRIGRIDRAGD